jgi:hypothetical protein
MNTNQCHFHDFSSIETNLLQPLSAILVKPTNIPPASHIEPPLTTRLLRMLIRGVTPANLIFGGIIQKISHSQTSSTSISDLEFKTVTVSLALLIAMPTQYHFPHAKTEKELPNMQLGLTHVSFNDC